MNKRSPLTSLLGAFLICLLALSVSTQVTTGTEPEVFRSMFTDILRSNKKAGGSVLVLNGCGSTINGALSAPLSGSDNDRLGQLTKNYPEYKISDRVDVPNLLPKYYLPVLLSSRIAKYEIDSDKGANDNLGRILALDELKAAVDASGLNKGMDIGIGPKSPPRKSTTKKTRMLTNVTLLEALNEVAAFYGSAVWAYTESHCNGEIRTRIGFTRN